MRDNEKEDARKRGGADKRGGAHSRYQFFRCGKIGGGADKRWGALWRYSTVYPVCVRIIITRLCVFCLGCIYAHVLSFMISLVHVSLRASVRN